MTIDATYIDFVEDFQWRVLISTELGQRNHELVPSELIQSISKIHGNIFHHLQFLLQHKLIAHEGKPYDGYHLTIHGYDLLALRTLMKHGTVAKIGSVIGRGKEADVFSGVDSMGNTIILKFHRVGRTSFRKAKDSRHYLQKRTSSWLYLSRLSAQTEYNNILLLEGFPIPQPLDWNRHCVVMSFVQGTLLNNITEMKDPGFIFEEIVNLAISLLKKGVVHADFSEFNIMIESDGKITLIDFPQCVPSSFDDAEEKFEHDLDELRRFFKTRFRYEVESFPHFADFLDEIDPIDMNQKLFKKKEGDDEDEKDTREESIQSRVSKEKRLRKPAIAKNPSKQKGFLQKEANSYK